MSENPAETSKRPNQYPDVFGQAISLQVVVRRYLACRLTEVFADLKEGAPVDNRSVLRDRGGGLLSDSFEEVGEGRFGVGDASA
jgi:hypothetical protein